MGFLKKIFPLLLGFFLTRVIFYATLSLLIILQKNLRLLLFSLLLTICKLKDLLLLRSFLIKVSIINRGRDFGILRQQHEEVASHETNEMIHGMKTIRFYSIRFYSLEDFFSKRFDQTLSKLVKLMRKTEVIKRLLYRVIF